MKGVIYKTKHGPKKLHRWFVTAYHEENFDSRKEALVRCIELRKQGYTSGVWTRERAMPPSRLRPNKEELNARS
jgi:hypothetical protein